MHILTDLRLGFAATLLAVSLIGTGCGPVTRAVPVQTEASAEGLARVTLHKVRGNIFEFSVANLSNEMLVVDRDSVRMVTAGGSRGREPGGAHNTYTIAPGAAHDVNVKFDTADLPSGETVRVTFEYAISVGGRPVPVAPLEFTLD